MAGWSFVVTPQSPAEYAQRLDRDAILAQWTTGAFGIGWIERLADEGRAERLERSGYPSVYTALAGDVVPLFGPERPPSGDDVGYEPWAVGIRWEALKGLASNARLTIVCWDQS